MKHYFVCVDCKWVFKAIPDLLSCPRCHGKRFKSAFHEFGNNAYKFCKTQKPWRDRIIYATREQHKGDVVLGPVKYSDSNNPGVWILLEEIK